MTITASFVDLSTVFHSKVFNSTVQGSIHGHNKALLLWKKQSVL